MINYIKLYLEPNAKALRLEAFESAKAYFKNKEKTLQEFQGYQRGYKNAYRSSYARTKLSIMKGN